jgi:hypothetical protein
LQLKIKVNEKMDDVVHDGDGFGNGFGAGI